MSDIAPSMGAIPDVVYRCNQCGIESNEPTCFTGVSTKRPALHAATCITCAQAGQIRGNLRSAWSAAYAIFLPLFILVVLKPNAGLSAGVVIACCFMPLLSVLLHELGHFFTARLLGLEAVLVTLGVGPKLWSGKLFGVPLQLHAWPTRGATYLGARSLRFLRLRRWVSVLMGPATNVFLILAAIILWNPLTRWVDANAIALWIVYNALIVISSALPHRTRESGRRVPNDGLRLLQIPFEKRADLEIYLYASAAVSAAALYADADYVGAQEAAIKALKGLPANPELSLILSACQINTGQYQAAQALLESLVDSPTAHSPAIRAAIFNNLSLAIWLPQLNTVESESAILRADSLSEQSFSMYPCVLCYRSTRALMLTACNRPQEALALLEYSNYDRGCAADRGERESTRAFALRHLHRNEEAEQALAHALRLNKTSLQWLTTLGLLPASRAALPRGRSLVTPSG